MKGLTLALWLALAPVAALAQGSDLSNPQTNASALTTGTVAAARGGAGTINGALKANGSGTVSQAACADLSNGTTNCSAAVGQLPGTTTNDAAAAGKVGEVLTGTGSTVSMVTSTAKTVTSLSITAGDWDVWCTIKTTPAAGTTQSIFFASITTTDNTVSSAVGQYTRLEAAFAATDPISASTPLVPVSLASTTTYYCVLFSAFAVSTLTADASLVARRRR